MKPTAVTELNLSSRATHALTWGGIHAIKDLCTAYTEQSILNLRGFGHTSRREVMKALADHGLSLGMTELAFDRAYDDREPEPVEIRMTLRDWFAGQVLAESCRATGECVAEPTDAETAAIIAKDAYILADAMISEKRRTEGGAA